MYEFYEKRNSITDTSIMIIIDMFIELSPMLARSEI